MKRQHYLLLLCGALPCFGVYTYYYTDALTSINLTKWTQNGTVSGTSIGLTGTSTAGGSLIHRDAVPDAANEYEVKTTLRLMNSGGYYVQYLGATSDARLGPTSAGTFVAVEMHPTISGGVCSMDIALKKRINNQLTTVATTTAGCGQTTTVRSVVWHSAAPPQTER